MSGDESWSEYQRLVLHRLDEHGEALTRLEEQMVGIRIEQRLDQQARKLKAGMWGGAFGFIPAFITALAVWFAGGSGS